MQAGTVTNRDSPVVVQELFRNAERSVLVAGYELYQAEAVFRTLANRMTDQAHIIETGSESYRFRRTLDKRRKKNPAPTST